MLTSILNMNGLLDLFGKTHPAVAHFPVALLLSALIAEILSWKFHKAGLHTAARFCLYIGTIGALVTTLTGFPFTQATFFNARPPMLVKHQLAAYMVVLLGITTSSMTLISRTHLLNNRFIYYLYILLLVIIAGLIIYTGHTGGVLVYGEDFFMPPSSTE
jgi:uncharacterized membrane protein